MVEFHGSEHGAAEDASRFMEIAESHGAGDMAQATLAEERTRLWRARHEAYWAILGAHPGKTAIVTDVCVPLSALAQAVTETQADIAASPIEGPILGHVGDGNFHAILLIDPKSTAERAAAEGLAHRMAERALRLGGTLTGEHGVGMGKLAYMRAEHDAAWEVMGLLKQALDPNDILNPGKVVPQG